MIIFQGILLYILAIIGWRIAAKIKMPAAPVLGSFLFLTLLRLGSIPLPSLPDNIFLFLQVALGVMVGARFNQETQRSMGNIFKPAVIVSTWALILAFVSGFVIFYMSELKLTTSILSSSIGGLPEMTVLAVATDADPLIVVFFHITRLVVTLLLFPIVFKYLKKKFPEPVRENKRKNEESSGNQKKPNLLQTPGSAIFTIAAAFLIGWLSIEVNIPAGGLVGAIIFMIVGGRLKLPVYHPPGYLLQWLLVGIGIMIADRFDPNELATLFSFQIIIPLLLSMMIIIGSSFLIAFLVTPTLAYFLYKYKLWKKRVKDKAIDGSDISYFKKFHSDREVKIPRLGGLLIWTTVFFLSFFSSGIYTHLPSGLCNKARNNIGNFRRVLFYLRTE